MAASTSNHGQRYPLFRTSIDKLFSNWQALQLAIENGQGGGYGKDIAAWMCQAVEDFFYQNDDLDGDEVAEFVGTMVDQELDTIVDDNSLEALGEALVQHFKLAASGKQQELQELFTKLDEVAAKPKPKASCKNDDGSDDESGDEEDMEVDEDDTSPSQGTSSDPNASANAGPSHHKTGKNFVTEPDDDGWVTVAKSKKH
ncbi:unnamed protein product [Orchesella dallaii]|uniref:Pre-rRNA-processing protein TSR2 homolog n=1 Tax=Orchesella dallaii TaxID=48710 RepID=A0ABP1QE91_9HEXA